MKLEVVRDGEAVELRLTEQDGSITVWVCDNEQTALYKLAALLFSKPEDEKKLRRSILVGTFEEKKPEKKRPLEEVAKDAEKRLGEKGLVKKGGFPDQAELEKLLKQISEQADLQPFLYPGLLPSMPNYPMKKMGIYPMLPQIGDYVPLTPTGIAPDFFPCETIITCGAPEVTMDSLGDMAPLKFSSEGEAFNFSSMKLQEQSLGSYKTSMGATVNVFKASSINGSQP